MKNKTYFLLVIMTLMNILSWSQTSRWNYHKLMDYGSSLQPAVNSYCSNSGITPTKITINLWDLRLMENKFYKGDIGFGERYYFVDHSTNGHFDSDENVKIYSFGNAIDNICSLISPKYHKVVLVGKTKAEADTNICSGRIAENVRWKLNITLENPLLKNKVYLMNFGRGLYYYKVEIAATYKGDSDYDIDGNSIGSPYQAFCDSDNDGVADDIDNCPNQAGPASNNGCPVQLKKPNLKLRSLKVKNTTTNKVIFNFPNGNTNTPTLKNNNRYDFSIEVENNVSGSTQANPVSLDMLINTSSTLYPDPRARVFNVSTDSNIGSISAGGSITKTFNVFVSNTIGSSPSLSNGNGYTLSFDIDRKGKVDESNENDNINQLQFVYSSSSRSELIDILNTSDLNPHEISVFTIYGTPVNQKTVTTKEEEDKFVNSLPKGFYIVKNNTETYKVVKE